MDARENKKIQNKYLWKGRYVSEKVYNARMKLSEAAKKRKRVIDTEEKQAPSVITGNRIINLKVMTEHMVCTFCKDKLLMQYIEKEHNIGLASVFLIRCTTCLKLNSVPTSDIRISQVCKKPKYDINIQSALASYNAGLGYTQLEKVLSVLDIPAPSCKNFRQYEVIVGQAIEQVAKKSCDEAAALERDLTIKNIDELKKLL